MNILVTGGAGFIGSHFVRTLVNNEIRKIVVLDDLSYAADIRRLDQLDITFIKGDICDKKCVLDTLIQYDITHIVHFAAESHVDRSLESIEPFLRTNILGTECLIHTADSYWSKTAKGYQGKMFMHISTDEVYGEICELDVPACETRVLNPSNPYAASKAAADQIVLSYINGKGFPALIVRSSNNFGLMQHPEKFIPKIVECLYEGKTIPIYGKGNQKRSWLYVVDYCEILMRLLLLEVKGEIFNVKGPSSLSNLETANQIKASFEKWIGKTDACVKHVEDRLMHDAYYHIEGQKLEKLIGPFCYTKIEDFIEMGRFFEKEEVGK